MYENNMATARFYVDISHHTYKFCMKCHLYVNGYKHDDD
jgi:hypothetical protein